MSNQKNKSSSEIPEQNLIVSWIVLNYFWFFLKNWHTLHHSPPPNPCHVPWILAFLSWFQKRKMLFVGSDLVIKNLIAGTHPVDTSYIFAPRYEFFGKKKITTRDRNFLVLCYNTLGPWSLTHQTSLAQFVRDRCWLCNLDL